MQKGKSILYEISDEDIIDLYQVNEPLETYIYDTENEHDKIFKDILNDKEEARKFINKFLELEIPIEKDKIELYNSSYITEAYKSKQADIVYKMKDKNIFFLIEHQSTIDLSMPYRIENYSMQIINTAIDKEKIVKDSKYLYPKVIPIVLYTGNKKWKAKLSFSEVQEKLPGYKEQDKSYTIVDVNSYNKKELLTNELFVTKVMLLEKSKTTKELIENAKEILEKVTEDKFNKIIKIINLLLGKKVGEEETKRILDTIIEKGEEDMLDVIERIEERERRQLAKSKMEGRKEGRKEGREEGREEGMREGMREGRIEGKKEGKIENTIEIAKRMVKRGCDIDFIYSITGLKKTKIEELING